MAKTILIVGYGTGISNAVAEKFGAEGFSVAIAARNAARLAEGVKKLEAKGVRAAAFPADASDPSAMAALIGEVRAQLGDLTVVHWNAYGGAPGDLLTADAKGLAASFDVAVTGLTLAVQAALPDLRKAEGAAVLVTNGGFGYVDPGVDAFCVQAQSMGLGLANAAKHKLVGLLSARLKPEGVYVGEVMVTGMVKGTAWDQGDATIDPSDVAAKFWALYQARDEIRAKV